MLSTSSDPSVGNAVVMHLIEANQLFQKWIGIYLSIYLSILYLPLFLSIYLSNLYLPLFLSLIYRIQ
jgi:hypothetical protein